MLSVSERDVPQLLDEHRLLPPCEPTTFLGVQATASEVLLDSKVREGLRIRNRLEAALAWRSGRSTRKHCWSALSTLKRSEREARDAESL